MSVETTAGPVAAPPPPAESRKRGSGLGWLLAVCCVAQFMVILDLSIVNVALPSIQSSLGFTSPELQWIVDAYAITFAGFLMLGGRAADHFGQRRMFVMALLVFALASLAGGVAADRTTLIARPRGAGRRRRADGGLLAGDHHLLVRPRPAAQPRDRRVGGDERARRRRGDAVRGDHHAGALLALGAFDQPSDRGRRRRGRVRGRERAPPRAGRSFDLAGALTLTIGQMVLVFGVVEAGLKGWDTFAALGPIIGGVLILAVFGVIETRFASEPLIPFKELTKPLRVANNIVLLFSASLFPMWFVSSLYLQQVLGLSPLHTGLVFLPMTLMIMAVASRAGKLVSRFGVRPVLGGGLIMLAAGMLLMAKIGSSGSAIVYIMLPGLLTAAGIAMSIVPSTIAATQGAKEGQAGLASGLVNTSRQIGGGLGLAILVTLATQRSSHLIGTGVQVPQALTDGFRLAYLIGGGLAAAAALVTFLAVPAPAGALRGAARRLTVAIGVVVVGFIAIDQAFAGSHGAPVGAYTTDGASSFVTEPSLHPPAIHKDGPTLAGRLAPGYILTTNFYNLNYPPLTGQSGPLILDDNLQPVWFKPVPEKVVAANLSPQTYEGQPALAWWQGVVTNTGSTESGEDVVVNRHYQTVARLKGADGWVLTLHALTINGERRVGDRQQERRTQPLRLRRRLQRGADRLRGAGVQPQDRQAAAHLGRARTHPTGGFLRHRAHQRVPVGHLPRQRARTERQRNLPRLDAQHVGRLPGEHRHRQDRVDSRRQALELQAWPARRLPVAARCGVRTRLELRRARARRSRCSTTTAASSPAAAPQSRRRGRRAGWCSISTSRPVPPRSSPSTPPAANSKPNTWATRSRWRTATCSSAGARSPTSRSSPAPGSGCWRATSPAPT